MTKTPFIPTTLQAMNPPTPPLKKGGKGGFAFLSLLALLALLTLLALLATPCFADDFSLYQKSGQKSQKWDSIIKAAFQAVDAGDLQTGYVFMQKAYNMGCRDGLLLFKLGIYYESIKNYKDAQKFLDLASTKLAEQYPEYKETKKIHEHLALLYYQSDQFDKALPEIEVALKTSPDNFMLLFMSAQIYRSQKQYSQAIANFEKALTVQIPPNLKPDPRKTILTELMALYYEMKDYDTCLKYAELILSVFPNDPKAFSYRQDIQQRKYKEREREAIKKIVE